MGFYNYDRRASGLPTEVATLIMYQEGTGFSAKSRFAVLTTKGWIGLDRQDYRGDIGGKPLGPVNPQTIEDAVERGAFGIVAEGVKQGGRFEHTAQLEGLGRGALIEAHDKVVWERQSDGTWDSDVAKGLKSAHFAASIPLGLKLKKIA